MPRSLKVAVSVVSLVACVLLIALWVRSYRHCDILEANSEYNHLLLGSVRGLVMFSKMDRVGVSHTVQWSFESYPPDYKEHIPGLFGFYYASSPLGFYILLPLWFPIVLTVAVAAVLVIRRPLQFSLRTLLIAVTVVAVFLGLIVMSR